MEARIAEINATIASLKSELTSIQATHNAARIPERVDKWLEQLASDFDSPVPEGLRSKLLAGLTSYPTCKVTQEEGKSYDPSWTVSEYTYTWNNSPVSYIVSSNPCHDEEYTLDGRWSDTSLEIDSWESLEDVEDKYKIAAIMHWSEDCDYVEDDEDEDDEDEDDE